MIPKTGGVKMEFDGFLSFLKNYKSGYVRRRSGQIVFQDYT